MSIEQRLSDLERGETDSRCECPLCRRRLYVLVVENDDPPCCIHCGAVLPDVADFTSLNVKRFVGVSMQDI